MRRLLPAVLLCLLQGALSDDDSGASELCCEDAPRRAALSWSVRRRKVTVSRAFSDDGRHGLAYILRSWGARTGAEIGVKDAFFSNILSSLVGMQRLHPTSSQLGRTNNMTLYMVDPWRQQENYNDLVQTTFGTGDATYKRAKEKVSVYGDKAVVLRNTSAEAAAYFRNHSLDFVYLDARHDYAAVKEDLTLWWTKLAPGGIMSGHDYYYGNDSCVRKSGQDWQLQADGTRSWKGVRGAVEEFFANRRTMSMIQAGWPMGHILTSLHKTIRRPLYPGMRLKEVRRGDCRFPSWMVLKRRDDWS